MTKPTATRSRTITWEDPVAAAEQRLDRSGLDHLNAIREGVLPPPPMAVLMGFDLIDAGEGRAVFAVTPEEFHYNPIGVVHGGLAATLIDSATGCAVQSTLEPGLAYTTLEDVIADVGDHVLERAGVHLHRVHRALEDVIADVEGA